MADAKTPQSPLHSAILEAVKGRVASISVSTLLADDTDCYAKGSPGDAYAKNKCSINLKGEEVILPPYTNQVFGAQGEKIQR
jgi:hypothetical protein